MSSSTFRDLLELLRDRYPNYAGVWERSLATLGTDWERDISDQIRRVFGAEPNARWDEAVDGYAEFCTDALRSQGYFERHGRYRFTSYADAVRDYYHSADYMKRRYLPGQFLSHSIWPHHERMLRRFTTALLPKIRDDVRVFYEIGVGCGMYSLKTLLTLTDVRGVGYDISEHALEFTMRVVKAYGLDHRYSVRNQDIISSPISDKADFVICQEVLEHLEDPPAFIRGLRSAVGRSGWGYITAAVNAAHVDHIYLYRSPDEVRRQIEQGGWTVREVQIEQTYAEKPAEFRPTIAGFLVQAT